MHGRLHTVTGAPGMQVGIRTGCNRRELGAGHVDQACVKGRPLSVLHAGSGAVKQEGLGNNFQLYSASSKRIMP